MVSCSASVAGSPSSLNSEKAMSSVHAPIAMEAELASGLLIEAVSPAPRCAKALLSPVLMLASLFMLAHREFECDLKVGRRRCCPANGLHPDDNDIIRADGVPTADCCVDGLQCIVG